MEAEYIASTETVKDIVWLHNFLTELGFDQPEPSQFFEDNQVYVVMVDNNQCGHGSQPPFLSQDGVVETEGFVQGGTSRLYRL